MNYIHQLFENTELFSVKENTGEIAIEGNNRSGILIICNSSLSNEEKNFLDKILSSVKLKLSDVMLMNSENVPVFHHLKTTAAFKKLILFGVTPCEIELNIAYTNYAPVDFQDTQILASESLTRLAETEASKTSLWNALKKMFL